MRCCRGSTVSTKLGFKNPNDIVEIEIGNDYTGGYCKTSGYNWFSDLGRDSAMRRSLCRPLSLGDSAR